MSARTFALVPAAGQSQRMGRPKLLLPLGARTVLQRVVGAFRESGINDVLVVTGPNSAELARQAEQAGAAVLQLPDQTPDMRATVEHGLSWLEAAFRPHEQSSWLLSPADHPTLRSKIVRELLEVQTANPQASIFLPTFEGKRGHPALIGWQHVPGISRLPAGVGLSTYLRRQAEQTFLMPVDSADVLLDLDTPEDYARLLERAW
jgi:molybdenum cofactor cytidylyltransferase